MSLAIACDGSNPTSPTGDHNAYIAQSVGWRKGATSWTIAAWRTAAPSLDANSLASYNAGGSVGIDRIGLDHATAAISPAGACASVGTDSLGYTRDYYGRPISSAAGAGFVGAVAP